MLLLLVVLAPDVDEDDGAAAAWGAGPFSDGLHIVVVVVLLLCGSVMYVGCVCLAPVLDYGQSGEQR